MRERGTVGELDLGRGLCRRCDYNLARGVSLLGRVAHLLHLHARLRNMHHSGRVLVLSVLEAAALAAVAARGAAQGDGEDDAYGDSCDEAFVEDAAVIRGAGAADFFLDDGVYAPPLVVFLVGYAACAVVVVVISGANSVGAATPALKITCVKITITRTGSDARQASAISLVRPVVVAVGTRSVNIRAHAVLAIRARGSVTRTLWARNASHSLSVYCSII